MAFLSKISGPIFYQNLAALQYSMYLQMYWTLWTSVGSVSDPKKNFWGKSVMPNLIGEKNSHMLMVLLNLAEQKTLHLCESTEFRKILVGNCFWEKPMIFPCFS